MNSVEEEEEEYDALIDEADLLKLEAQYYAKQNITKKLRKGYLSITDITSLQWCQQQVYYQQAHLQPRQTTPMKRGKDIHKELEEETNGEDVVVDIQSKEDAWAIYFINMYSGLSLLIESGKTREIPLFGVFEGCLIFGIVDEFERQNDMFVISDTKTRRRNYLPNPTAMKPAMLQLMLYQKMWDDLTSGKFTSDTFFQHTDKMSLDLDLALTMQEHVPRMDTNTWTLRTLVPVMFEIFQNRMMDTYPIIGTKSFQYDETWSNEQMKVAIKFWNGEIDEPVGCQVEEVWKCNSCDFINSCEWRMKQC